MSASRPSVVPDWATSTNFASGPDAGTPNKVDPGSGMRAEGFDPQAYLAAQHANFLLNNHGVWIDYLDAVITGGDFWLYDDFLDATIATKWALVGTSSVIDDSANGASGAVKLNPGHATGTLKTAFLLPAIAGDFAYECHVKLGAAQAVGDGAAFSVLDFGTAHWAAIEYTQGTNGSRWYQQVDGAALVDLIDAPSTTAYQKLQIYRIGGTLFFAINDTVRNSVAYATTITAGKLVVSVTGGVAATVDVRIDDIKLWVPR